MCMMLMMVVVVVAACCCLLQLLLACCSLLRLCCAGGVLLLPVPAGLASCACSCLPLMLHGEQVGLLLLQQDAGPALASAAFDGCLSIKRFAEQMAQCPSASA